MTFISILPFLSLLLAAAVAQEPNPCEAPQRMNGDISIMAPHGLMAGGRISYDAVGQRTRVTLFGMAGNETFVVDVLMLFNEKVYYEIDWRTLTCKKKALDITFSPMQVPSDAELKNQMYLGSSSFQEAGLLANVWQGQQPNNSTYLAVFTENGCFPVTSMGYTPGSGWTIISTFNWVLGNTNPLDFHPPWFCAKSSLESTETPHTVFTALESLAMQTKEAE